MSSEEKAKEVLDAITKAINGPQTKTNSVPLLAKDYVSRPQEAKDLTKKLTGISTGTFIDDLFLNPDQTPLGGIPTSIQLGLTGLPEVGKSILLQEILLDIASSHEMKVLFVTSEDAWNAKDRFDLEARMREKTELLKLDWSKVRENLYVLDAVSKSDLTDWEIFTSVYKSLCETEGIRFVGIDTITLLEDNRGSLKYRLKDLTRFNQTHGITAILINQRATDEWDSWSMAGGIGIAHGLDATLIVDYGKAWNELVKRDLNVKQGTMVRIARLTGCRLCNFDGSYHNLEISNGLLRLNTTPST